MSFATLVQRRYDNDNAAIVAAINTSALTQCSKDHLLSDLAAAYAATNAAGVSSTGFKTLLPYETAHGNMFKVLADLWYAQGHTVMRAWAVNPWGYPTCYAEPSATPGTMTLIALLNDVRPTAIRVANPSQSDMTVSLTITGLPGSPIPTWATVYAVTWSDTAIMQTGPPDWRRDGPVLSRMEQITASGGKWSMTVKPGLTAEFWINWNCTSPCNTTLPVASVTDGTTTVEIPLTVQAYGVDMPSNKAFDFGTWDRLDTQTKCSANIEAYCQAVGYNCPIASDWAMIQGGTGGTRVTSAPNDPWVLTTNWTNLNTWLAANPSANRFIVVLGSNGVGAYALTGALGLTGVDDENFDTRVDEWADQLYANLVAEGVEDKFYVQCYDEPDVAGEWNQAAAFMKVIKGAGILTMGNPALPADDLDNIPADYIGNVDMLILVYNDFVDKADSLNKTQQELATWCKTYGDLGFYEATGPCHGLDPWYTFRMMGIRCYALGAESGVTYWPVKAGDFGGYAWVGSNEYNASVPGYLTTPLWIESDAVTTSKQMEGIRAAQQDYETCQMLSSLITSKTGIAPAATISAAQAALDAFEAVADLTETAYSTYMAWQTAHTTKGDYTSLDDARSVAVQQIAVLSGQHGAVPPSRTGVLAL